MNKVVSALCFAVVFGISQTLSIYENNEDESQLSELVHRMKRSSSDGTEDVIHGHSIAVLHAEDPFTGELRRLGKRDLESHVAQPSDTRLVKLVLNSGDEMEMVLRRRNVLTSASTILERRPGGEDVYHQPPKDCVFASQPGSEGATHAAFSFCAGTVLGTFQKKSHRFHVFSLPAEVANRSRRSVDDDTLPLLVTWTNLRESRKKREAEFADSIDDEPDDIYGTDDILEDGGADPQESLIPQDRTSSLFIRNARNPADKVVVIETAVVVDSSYVREMGRVWGFNDTKSVINLVALKWSGVWAVLSDPKLGWNVTMSVTRVEVWNEDPAGYDSSDNVALNSRLGSICRYTASYTEDVLTLLTSAKKTNGASGLAWVGGVCKSRRRCSAVLFRGPTFAVELHELGHSLGLVHERGACPNDSVAGFMGGGRDYLNACYRSVFDRLWPTKSCLFKEESTTTAANVSLYTTGQLLTLDKNCQYEAGEEYTYVPSSRSVCYDLVCLASDPTKASFGTMKRIRPAQGQPCGHEMICRRAAGCVDVNVTSYVEVYKRHVISDGQWGAWSGLSPCRVSTPGAVALRTQTRACTFSGPAHGAYCNGTEVVRAEVCTDMTSHPLPLDKERLVLDICAARLNNPNTTAGFVVTRDQDFSQCSVQCQGRPRKPLGDVFYALPDGVGCGSESSEYEESLSGRRSYCLRGKCTTFGCNGRSMREGQIRTLDACGVCGGSGDSCVHGKFDGILEPGASHSLVTLPAGATSIYVTHPFISQRDVSIEIWGEGEVIITTTTTTSNTTRTSVLSKADDVGWTQAGPAAQARFAGTEFYLNKEFQSVSAAGPLRRPVVIKLKKEAQRSRVEAFYRYQLAQTFSQVQQRPSTN